MQRSATWEAISVVQYFAIETSTTMFFPSMWSAVSLSTKVLPSLASVAISTISNCVYWTTDMASQGADRCMQLFGGYGYCEEYPIARAWRDIRVTRIFAGTNEIMKTIAARFMGL